MGDINLVTRLRQGLARGAFGLAKQTALQLVDLAPDNSFYRAKLAAAYLGLGQTAEAVQVVEQTEIVSAANVADFLRVARTLFDADERERGRKMARRLMEAEETADGWFQLAQMAAELDDNAAFEEALRRALALEPEHGPARLERARTFIEQEKFGPAEEELQRLLKIHPIHALAHLSYARLLRASGRPKEALSRLERVLRLLPAWCEAHLEHLELLIELDQPEPAQAALSMLRRKCQEQEARTRATELVEAMKSR